jgi:hypothetical protein
MVVDGVEDNGVEDSKAGSGGGLNFGSRGQRGKKAYKKYYCGKATRRQTASCENWIDALNLHKRRGIAQGTEVRGTVCGIAGVGSERKLRTTTLE